jgi:hypothetical protein
LGDLSQGLSCHWFLFLLDCKIIGIGTAISQDSWQKKSKFVKKGHFNILKTQITSILTNFVSKSNQHICKTKNYNFILFSYKNSNGVSSCFPSPKQKQKTTKEKLTHNPFMMIISFSDIKHYVLTLTIDNIIFQK